MVLRVDFEGAALEIEALGKAVVARGDAAGNAVGIGSARIDGEGALTRRFGFFWAVGEEEGCGPEGECFEMVGVEGEQGLERGKRLTHLSQVELAFGAQEQGARMPGIEGEQAFQSLPQPGIAGLEVAGGQACQRLLIVFIDFEGAAVFARGDVVGVAAISQIAGRYQTWRVVGVFLGQAFVVAQNGLGIFPLQFHELPQGEPLLAV